MPHEHEWHPEFGIWVFFRVIFALVIVGIVFSIFFGGFSTMPFYNAGWAWEIVGFVFLLWLVSWVFVWPWRHRYWEERHEMRILRRRYARGEISRAQFKRMMKDLQHEEK